MVPGLLGSVSMSSANAATITSTLAVLLLSSNYNVYTRASSHQSMALGLGMVVQRVWLTGSVTAERRGAGPREVEEAGGGGGAPLPGAAGGAARPAGRQGEGCGRGGRQVSCASGLPALATHSHAFWLPMQERPA